MSVEAQIQELLKESMRNKDTRTLNCLKMIKTKHMERRTAAGFNGPLDDNLWLDVIAAYQKQLRKSRDEYATLGERGAGELPGIDFEIAVCAKFLPALAGEDEVRAAVQAAIAQLGATDPKQAGRIMGEIMKQNKGKFEPPMVKRLVEEALAKAGS
jgi:uncharacterized protein YqeY